MNKMEPNVAQAQRSTILKGYHSGVIPKTHRSGVESIENRRKWKVYKWK